MKYNTEQKKILLEFFSKHTDEYISTVEILDALRNENISESAIYRNLVSLEKDGKLRRRSKLGDRKTYYQYLDDENCSGHIHISCISCGKTTHIPTSFKEELANKLKEQNNFTINGQETVIYGLCSNCKK